MTFARGRYGDIYGVNGVDRGLRWDGVTAAVEQLGLTAPVTPPTVTPSYYEPKYFVRSVDVVDGGFCYQKVPAVTFSGGGGLAAAAKAEVLNGRIHRIVMQSYGRDYTSAPTVSVAAPDGSSPAGSGATFTVTISGFVLDIRLTNVGAGYTSPPTVTVSSGGGSGALVRASIDEAGTVVGVAIVNAGSGYTSTPTVTFSASPGTTATGTAVVQYHVASVSVTAAGSGYSGIPRLTFQSSNGGGAYAECTVGTGGTAGQITAVTVRQGGAYLVAPTASIVTPAGLLPRSASLSAVAQPCLTGKYWCALRYVDDTPEASNGPIASSITDLTEVELTGPAGSLAWSWSNSGAEARASRVELWRTTSDQALVLYRVASLPRDGSNNLPTTYTDVWSDAGLIDTDRTKTATVIESPAYTLSCPSHGLANNQAIVFVTSTDLVYTAGVTYYARDVDNDTFKIAATAGGAALEFDPTHGAVFTFTTPWFGALPVVLPNGQPNAKRFTPPPTNKSAIVMFQDRAWYGVDTSGSEPNSLYFSEVDEPESVPDTNELVIQENVKGTDKISALMPFGAALVAFQQRRAYRLSYAAQPVIDASIVLLAHRGCLNQRCWDIHDGVAYVVDSIGMYMFDGQSAVALSDAVDTFWTDNLIHFPSSKWFFVRVDPQTRIVRFFYAASAGMPDRALCFHPMTKGWWVESYAQTFAAAECVISSSRQTVMVGGQTGAIYRLDSGTQDINGSGAATGIACTYRTGNLPFDPKEADRGIRLLYKPTTNDCTLSLALHYNNSSSARQAAVRTDRGTGFTTEGGEAAKLNLKLTRSPLGDATGHAICAYAGRVDDQSAGADRHLAINISATRTASNDLTLHGIAVSGVGQ